MSFHTFYKTLDTTDSSRRYVALDGTVVSGNVALDLIGGTAQSLTGDFYVGGDMTTVRWDSTSYGLFSSLSSGDKIRVIYDRT